MRVIITGATGFVGQPLCRDLIGAGHSVTALSRDAGRARAALRPEIACLAWNDPLWKQALGETDVVIHLAGASVGEQRWTPEYKKKLLASRVDTTRALVDAMRAVERKPAAFVCASAVGYYGDRKDEMLTEEAGPGEGFLADLCRQWEEEALKASAFGVRVVRMRLGVALGQGGALEKMLHPFPIPLSPWKLGLGGPLGSGKQWTPWIHLEDAVGMFFWAATHFEIAGAVNVVAPNPVTNAEFSRALGRALHRPSVLPMPAFVLRALLGEFAETVLTGQRVLPLAAQKGGYRFRFPDIDSAFRSLLK